MAQPRGRGGSVAGQRFNFRGWRWGESIFTRHWWPALNALVSQCLGKDDKGIQVVQDDVDTIDPLHIMGMQPIWRTKQKKCSLLGIEIYSHIKKSYCSVLQIGYIPTDVQGVYKLSLCFLWLILHVNKTNFHMKALL